jgi:hypothetical protein
MRLIFTESRANRAIESGHGNEPLSLLALITVLGDGAAREGTMAGVTGAEEPSEDIVAMPRKVLAQSLGASKAADLLARARADLGERVRLLLDEELLRFVQVLDAAGPVDPIAAVRLYQAEYNLEAVR